MATTRRIPKVPKRGIRSLDFKLDAAFWEAFQHMLHLAEAGDEPAGIAHMYAYHDERKRRAAAADATPDAPEDLSELTSNDEPTHADRFAQYVEDWSEAEEEAFEEAMQELREREARRALQNAPTGSPGDDDQEDDQEDV